MSRSLVTCSLLVLLIHHVKGHGRLMEPPGRNVGFSFKFLKLNDNFRLFVSQCGVLDG